MSFIKKNNYLFIYLFILGAINLSLQFLPLTNVFGYEFSAINALIISFLSGLYTLSLLKESLKENLKFNSGKLLNAIRWLLLIPFVISIGKSLIFGFCSFWDGIFFYLVLTFPSVIIGSALGALSGILFNKFKVILFFIVYALILFIPVLEIYFNPQVYLYNPLFAYFPGTIYDEGLTVDFQLLLYRIFNLLFFLPILIYAIHATRKSVSIRKKFSIIIVLTFISAVFYFLISPLIGYTTTESSIKKYLSNKVESEHFIIYTDRRISEEELKIIALNHEYYYIQLVQYFKSHPDTKIKSYFFFDSVQKKNLFGSGSADIAKPWLNSIYVSLDSWENTLKHEIAHCFTAKFGTGIFKLASGFNPALIEGVAEAADGIYDGNDIHFLASLAFKNNYKIDINSVFSGFSFFGTVSTLSYIYSGSFIKYLSEVYGIKDVKAFYRNGNFNKSFPVDMNSVIKDYETFLDTLSINKTVEEANYYFGRKALISKVCPRYISSALAVAWNDITTDNYGDAQNIFEDILSKAESYSAIVGLAKIYENQDSISKAIDVYQLYLNRFTDTASEYDLKLRLADLYILNNQKNEATESYKFLASTRPNKRLTIISDTRLTLLQNDLLKDYLTGSDFDKYEILKKLNSKSYYYSSISIMIELSKSLDENYNLFLNNFEKDFQVKDETSSYALLKLSEYMIQNFDFLRARKTAGFSVRYKNNLNLLEVTELNFQKADWFLRNSETFLERTKFEINSTK